jgi:hypothetical protein
MPSRVQAITGTASTSTTLTLTLPAAPTAGNLLVFICYSAAGVTQASASVPGFDLDVITNTSTTQSAVILSRIADGTEAASHTLTWASATTSTVMGELIEVEAGTGRVWSAAQPEVAGSATGTGTSGTVAASSATAGASYAFAAFGLGGTSAFLNTWNGGFTWDGGTVGSGRFRVAVKDSLSGETLSTTETWDTSRQWRGVLAAYVTEATPAVGGPENIVATAISDDAIDVTWDAVSGAVGYDVRRDGVVIQADHPTTSYSDSGLTPLTEYDYDVRGVL